MMESGFFLVFVLLLAGIAGLAYFSYQLKQEKSELQARIDTTEIREAFAKAIFKSSPSEEVLAKILAKFFPKMFPDHEIQFWMFLERNIWGTRSGGEIPFALISAWMLGREGIEVFHDGDEIPWENDAVFANASFLVALQPEGNETPIAGIYLESSNSTLQQYPAQQLIDTERSLRYCVDYISNFLAILQKAHQDLELQSVQQEIAIASQIQSDLLPIEYPVMPGWQLSFSLRSAGDLSGDFFDLIPISKTQIGILVADVAGKGLGAALYMALCRTLIRTFAKDYASRPDLVITECNERLLEDARDALFVTAFYGVLDFEKNELIYTNAGHNPPFIMGEDDEAQAKALPLTGLPIGIDKEEQWTSERIMIEKGELFLIYSDGIPDAQNAANESLAMHACWNRCAGTGNQVRLNFRMSYCWRSIIFLGMPNNLTI